MNLKNNSLKAEEKKNPQQRYYYLLVDNQLIKIIMCG